MTTIGPRGSEGTQPYEPGKQQPVLSAKELKLKELGERIIDHNAKEIDFEPDTPRNVKRELLQQLKKTNGAEFEKYTVYYTTKLPGSEGPKDEKNLFVKHENAASYLSKLEAPQVKTSKEAEVKAFTLSSFSPVTPATDDEEEEYSSSSSAGFSMPKTDVPKELEEEGFSTSASFSMPKTDAPKEAKEKEKEISLSEEKPSSETEAPVSNAETKPEVLKEENGVLVISQEQAKEIISNWKDGGDGCYLLRKGDKGEFECIYKDPNDRKVKTEIIPLNERDGGEKVVEYGKREFGAYGSRGWTMVDKAAIDRVATYREDSGGW